VDGRVGLSDAITVDWWGAKTTTPSLAGHDDIGYSIRGAYQTADWNNNARIVQVGRDFNPEVGFLNRTGGYRYVELSGMRFVRNPDWKWLKDWNPHTTYRGYYGLGGGVINSQLHIDMTELELADGGK